MRSSGPIDAKAPVRDGFAIAGFFLLVYLAFGQSTLYRDDGHHILQGLLDRRIVADRHHLAMPIYQLFCSALGSLGVSNYRSAAVLSAFGAALGLLWTHLACRLLGMSRRASVMATTMVGSVPPLVFYATLVEFHGPFLCFAQLVFLAAAWFMLRPGAGRAAILGFAVTAAWLMHSSALFLGVIHGCIILGSAASLTPKRAPKMAPKSRRSLAFLLGLTLLVQAGSTAVALAVLDRAEVLLMDRGLTQVEVFANLIVLKAAGTPLSIVNEWFVVYLPLSLCFLFVFARREWRGPFLGTCVGIVMLCSLSALLLARLEWGAYLLPMAAPMAVLVARSLPAWLCAATAVCGLAVGLTWVVRHDQKTARYQAIARGLNEVGGGAPGLLLTVSLDEWGSVLVENTKIAVWPLFGEVLIPREIAAAKIELFDDCIEQRRPRGGRVLISATSLELLRSGATPTATLLLESLHRNYDMVAVRAAGFEGYRLEQKHR